MNREAPLLHRDDPEREPLTGNVKVTREDWLAAALDVLKHDGVEKVKVLTLAERLGVSRSSFYWYFDSRKDLLGQLLKHWESTNTAAMVAQAEAPAETITEAACNVFRCVVNPGLFDVKLDFTIRDWARRDAKVRAARERSDAARIAALTAMFARFGFGEVEALTRARVLYYMQIGYDDADLGETIDARMALLPHYLKVFTGQEPRPGEVAAFRAYAIEHDRGEAT